ncbi:MAG: amidohydrolase [Planctomycetes bacterium]|nr:amidohydrolase [Planctomycetota bacterium]
MPASKSLLCINGRFHTMNPDQPHCEAVVVRDGVFIRTGGNEEMRRAAGPDAAVIDLAGRLALPGLHDSHIHLIRGGLNYNLELRWEGVPSLADAMRMLRMQVENTPPPQWVRVVGGFTLNQFAEKRLPTLDELNHIAPDTPVFILHLYDRALLNAAALRAVGYDKNTPEPLHGEISRDKHGNPTGLIIAKPDAGILYATLALGPKLSAEDQVVSTKLFMRELNRLGLTSAIDAGGGFQNYPDDYAIIQKLHDAGELTIRIAYNLFTQKRGGELGDFQNWTSALPPLTGDSMYRHNGAGEMLVFSAADFEDFRQVRPNMPPSMEGELEKVVRLLAEKRWPFRLHATYDETIDRVLAVFEKVDADIPFNGLHWFFDHAETISDANIDRIASLGGGVAIQHRMAYQGEFFIDRYGADPAGRSPPIRKLLQAGLPVGAGTDATRVASYNPWVCLYWLVTGKTVAGTRLTTDNRLDRHEALKLWTVDNAWFANSDGAQGMIAEDQAADFIVPAADYFTIAEEEIRNLYSDLTVVGGTVVHGNGKFSQLAPPMPKVSPSWSPVARFGGKPLAEAMHSIIHETASTARSQRGCCGGGCGASNNRVGENAAWLTMMQKGDESGFWNSLGCDCWI